MKITWILTGVLFLAGFATRLEAQSYTVTELGTLGGIYGVAYGINNSGQVVGVSETSGGAYHATLFGGIGSANIDLGTIGGSESFAYGISNSGQIVGQAETSGGAEYATLFSGNGSGNTDLGALGGTYSYATSINNFGQIVGLAYDSGNDAYYATLFSGNGSGNTDLGTLGGTANGNLSYALGINDSGQIVGQAETSGTEYQATLFGGNGSGNTDLGTLGGTSSVAYGISNSGQIVGQADTTGNSAYHATLYSGNGSGNTDLGTLGGSFSAAYAINNSGQIVGDSYTSGNAANDGFLYASGVMTDLNSLVPSNAGVTGISVGEGNVINDWGQIAANGTVAGNGVALLLNPVNPLTSVSGGVQDVKLVAGMNYSKVAAYTDPTGDLTQVSFLDGTAAINRDVQVSFLAGTAWLRSDIAELSITAPDGSINEDTFVLQLSYTGSAPGTYLGFFDTSTDEWENAVLGDTNGGAGGTFVDGAYNPSTDFVLGDYGVNTSNHTVWAVVDQPGEFAAVPEPSTWTMVAGGAALLIGLRRRVNRAVVETPHS
jgi:probable HAF family extracellular repeat protein